MKVKILYDGHASPGYRADWGFACLIEGDESVLFDTGARPDVLAHNMSLAGVSCASIDKVVLSHDHWDHTGGLPHLHGLRDDVAVFALPGFSPETLDRMPAQARIQEVTGPDRVAVGLSTTGPIGARVPEQALWFSSPEGLVMVIACGHPGVDAQLMALGTDEPVHGLIGGFHGFHGFDVLRNVPLLAPCHCTEYRHAIAQRFPDAFLDVSAGAEIVICPPPLPPGRPDQLDSEEAHLA